ncbi:hypothetical protein [Sanguibacter sp. Z1732]
MHPLTGCERSRDQLLDLVWTLCLDIAARTGHEPEVVALTHGLVPAHAPKVVTTNRAAAQA